MYFHEPVVKYLESIKYPTPPKTPYSARYIGSMVADVHRTLLYGGIFGYPDDKKSKSGKLRLLYEAFPMAFLTEQVCPFGLVSKDEYEYETYIPSKGRWCGNYRDETYLGHSAQKYPRALFVLPR